MSNRVKTDLEKAASGASGACGHFVGNPTILRTFGAKCPVFFTNDRKRRVEDGELRLRMENGGFRIQNWG